MVKYVYTLGASGERVKVEELDRTVEYTYDSLYRLTSETITKGKTKTTYTYAYDNVSNRTLKTVDGDETVYTYNALNQLVSEDGTTYEYDNAGNLVRVVGTGKTALYVYNADNKLVKATVQQGNNVVVETYTYDYAGNRTSKTTTINNHVEKVYYLNDNSSLTKVLKIKPCKRNNRQKFNNTKNAAKHRQKLSKLSSEERPDADCGIKW